jgi:hypothetical protein
MVEKAPDKATKRKRRAAADATKAAPTLRLHADPREERRYEGRTSPGAVVAVVIASLGAVSVGAGTYGQWGRQWFGADSLGPHKYAFAMLAAGAAALLLVLLFGPRPTKPIRVGDAGVAVEKDGGEIERIAWCDVERVSLVAGSMLTFQSSGASIAIPIALQPQAAARAMAEAQKRIPAKVAELDGASLPQIDPVAGEVQRLEPPQVAGLRCKKSDKLIAFERDGRLCSRCGELYHKDSVPSKCLTCEARL